MRGKTTLLSLVVGGTLCACTLTHGAEPPPKVAAPVVPAPPTQAQRIESLLAKRVDVRFARTSLPDAVKSLNAQSELKIVMAPGSFGVARDVEYTHLTMKFEATPLRLVLNHLGRHLNATWRVMNDADPGIINSRLSIVFFPGRQPTLVRRQHDVSAFLAAVPVERRSSASRQIMLLAQELPRSLTRLSRGQYPRATSESPETFKLDAITEAHEAVRQLIPDLISCQKLQAKRPAKTSLPIDAILEETISMWRGDKSLPGVSLPIHDNAMLFALFRMPVQEDIGDVTLNGLADVLSRRFRKFSLNVVLDLETCQYLESHLETKFSSKLSNVSLDAALNVPLNAQGFYAFPLDGALVISRQPLDSEAMAVKVYPIFDLERDDWSPPKNAAADAPETIAAETERDSTPYGSLLQSMLALETWEKSGGLGATWYCGSAGGMVVAQSEAVHSRIDLFLTAYRKLLADIKTNPKTAAAVDPQESEAALSIRQKLKAAISEVKLDKLPLEEAIREVCGRQNVPFQLHVADLKAVGVESSTLVSWQAKEATLHEALVGILKPLELTYHIRSYGVLLITSPDSGCDFGHVRLYPVADLIEQGKALPGRFTSNRELKHAIRLAVSPGDWAIHDSGNIVCVGDDPILAIRQKEAIHRDIEAHLTKLRAELAGK